MRMNNTEERFIDIEMALSNLERVVEDLNDVIIKQGKDIAFLQKQNHYLTEALRNTQSTVKEQEEAPPLHIIEKLHSISLIFIRNKGNTSLCHFSFNFLLRNFFFLRFFCVMASQFSINTQSS